MSEPTADEIISKCLELESPTSFFLFAGAGSGKTRSLVEVLKEFKTRYAEQLRLKGQRVGIITYTKAARDVIEQRLKFDPVFSVSTIHSFSWDLIKAYTNDIRQWLAASLKEELEELESAQAKGRAGTKAAVERELKIISKSERLKLLPRIRKFIYNPDGNNLTKDSLNHAEVIKLVAFFLGEKPLMQSILVQSFPILLIDESQDTNKELINALFKVEQIHEKNFCLGLFGDTMQRIYNDGEETLGQNIPASWKKPSKVTNYRSPRRVIDLINKVRSEVDSNLQEPRKGAHTGHAHLFIAQSETNKLQVEKSVLEAMAKITEDALWTSQTEVKTLCLEHKMSARRGGFGDFFCPLYDAKAFGTELTDGTLPGALFFRNQVIPLIEARRQVDKFNVARIVRDFSPILDSKKLESAPNPAKLITQANNAVESLYLLWDEQPPRLIDILVEIDSSTLFRLPDDFKSAVSIELQELSEEGDERSDKAIAWEKALQASYDDMVQYTEYVSEKSRYGTHQGVKGEEFPRVLVILDDQDAGGFLFSYEKLFGAKDLSATDLRNEHEGKDTTMSRTRRLFYVACSRAEEGLAVLAYTHDPNAVKKTAIDSEWFTEEEVVSLD